MDIYGCKRVYIGDKPTMAQVFERARKASILYCIGLDDLKEHMGGRLRKSAEIGCYWNVSDDYEYIAYRER